MRKALAIVGIMLLTTSCTMNTHSLVSIGQRVNTSTSIAVSKGNATNDKTDTRQQSDKDYKDAFKGNKADVGLPK